MSLIELGGWLGMALVLTAYGLNVSGRWSARCTPFLVSNIVGSLTLAVLSWSTGTWPVVCLNGVWLAVSFYGLARGRKPAREGC